MSEVARIAELLEQSVRGRPYHGPSLLTILRPVTRDLAIRRTSPNLHTIWELVAHVGAEYRYARSLIDSSATPWIEGETTWPAIADTSEAAWLSTLRDLEDGHRTFLQFLAQLDDEALGRRAVRGRHSVYAVLHGVVQHCAYHAGQIALLTRQA